METTILALALLLVAVLLAAVGFAGLRERLPRNRWVGLRIAAVRADDERWRIGHRAAGSVLIVAAGPPLLLGAALIAAPPEQLEDWLIVLIAVGLVTGGLLALAARQARQAIEPDHEQERP